MPAAIVGVLAGSVGLLRPGYDLDASSLRLGVALIVSVVSLFANAATGDVVLAGSGVVATVALGTAWESCQRLRRDRRMAWGARQRVVLERSAQLQQRHAALRDGP